MKNKKIIDTAAKNIINELEKHNGLLKMYNVRRIGLFGSYATGKQMEKSDIDFLIEFKKPDFNNFMDLVFALESLFNKKVELITNGNLSPYVKPFIEKEIKWHEV